MKPFDLEKAKAGHPVVTRDGRQARIICFDRDGDDYPIVALIKNRCDPEAMFAFRLNGSPGIGCKPNVYDLFMATIQREGYVILFPVKGEHVSTCEVFNTHEEAEKKKIENDYLCSAVIAKVTWEE